MLGIYGHSKQEGTSISGESSSEEAIQKFVKIALTELQIPASSIKISKNGKKTRASFFNSKMRKAFDQVLSKRGKIFKYANQYACEYVGGMFDACGNPRKGIAFSPMELDDYMLLEHFGVHLVQYGKGYHVLNEATFMSLFKRCSVKLSSFMLK